MAKTLSTIIEVAGFIALGVATAGVGLAVAAGGGLIASIGAAATIVGLGFVPTSIIAGLALGGLVTLLGGGGSPKAQQTETAIKSPTPVRVSGYGEQRIHMTYALYVTAGDGTAIDVGAVHDGRVDAIIGYYLGDTRVTLLGNGYVQVGADGQFGDHSDLIRIITRLGAARETAFGEVTAKYSAWDGSHRGDGVVTAAVLSAPVKSKYFQRNYPTGGPNNMPLSLVMRLQPVFDWRDPSQSAGDSLTWKWSENAILHLAHYLLVRDNKDWATHFAPTIAWWTAAADVCDEQVAVTGEQAALVQAASKDSGHLTLTNVTDLAVGMSIAIYSTGDTTHTETRTVTGISGQIVGLSSALVYDHPQGSQVEWAGSGATEARYRGCVVHKHTDPHKDVVASLLACCDGWLQPRADGALVVYAGAYVAPDADDLIGPDAIVSYSIQDGVEEENAINQIALTYISSAHDYAAVDTDVWEDAEDQARRGKVLATQLTNQVPSHGQARRLGKIAMARLMTPKRGSVTTNSRGRNIRGKRYVRLQIVEAGTTFLDAVVEITKLTRNMGTFGYTAEWVLADPNAFAWNAATEGGNPAPVGDPVALDPLVAPIVVSVTPTYSQDAAYGQPGVRLTVIASGPTRVDLTWYVRTRPVGGVSWVEQAYPDEDAGTSVTLQTDFVPLAMLEAEVAYGVGDGRISPWGSLASATDASGATPGAVTGLSVSANADGSLIVADWADASFATSYRVELIV